MLTFLPTALLWRSALAAIPLALAVAVACRWLTCRPATRHALWLMVLLWMVVAPVLPTVTSPEHSATDPGVEPRSPAALLYTEAASSSDADVEGAGQATPPSIVEQSSERGTVADGNSDGASRSEPSYANKLAQATGSGGELHKIEADRPSTTGFVGPLPVLRQAGDDIDDVRLAQLTTTPPTATLHDICGDVTSELKAARSQALAAAKNEYHKRADTHTLAPARVSRAATERPSPAEMLIEPGFAEETPTAQQSSIEEVAPEKVGQWRRWVVGWLAIRDAVGNLPPIPTNVWALGVLVFASAKMASVIRFRRRVRSAVSAPENIVRMVNATAAKMGLRHVPEVLTVTEQMSPVVWCGRRPRLLLPTGLWSQLDDTGRQAVICHELAHLRRRDHWVCWTEVLVGLIYWWHPLVWWVRHRIDTEAELCCDAWVTWMMPRQRRAYARVLLATKQYVNQRSFPMPAVGIGVTSGRAGRFGRRLTMIMTQTMAPRISIPGIALAAVLAMVGWVATPAQSCPPKAGVSDVAALPKPCTHGQHNCEHRDSGECACPDRHTGKSATTFERHIAKRRHATRAPKYILAGDHEDDRFDDRLSRLEDELEELADRLDEMMDRLGERLERRLPRKARTPRTPRTPHTPRALHTPITPPVPPVPIEPLEHHVIVSPGETVTRAYTLPEGRLEALTAIMVRPDVPILVRPGEDELEVMATEAQHSVFARFVDMIGSEDRVRKHKLHGGKLEALSELMVRSDVPITVRPGDDYIEVHGTTLEQEVFQGFVELIHPCGHHIGAAGPDEHEWDDAKENVEKAKKKAKSIERKVRKKVKSAAEKKARKKCRERRTERESSSHRRIDAATLGEAAKAVAGAFLEKFAGQGHDRDNQAESLDEKVRSFRDQAQSLKQAARQLEDKARQLERQAEQLDDEADSLRKAANGVDAAQRVALITKAANLMAEAAAIEAEAETVEAQAETIEDEAERFEEQAEAFEEAAESTREALEMIADDEDSSDEDS